MASFPPGKTIDMNPSANRKAVLQALFVTFLWATSWVLIKWGLEDLPPITFAGLRYVLAFIILLPLAARPALRAEIRSLTRREWAALALLGLVYYTLTQGAQFLGLAYLQANTLSLLLSLSSLAIAGLGILFLSERLSRVQWLGVLLSLAGAFIYFGSFGALSNAGWLIGLFAVLANSAAAVLGRAINRHQRHSPLVVTLVSMGVGSLLLLALGLATEPLPSLTLPQWGIVLWLAAVNTAGAFTLWNHTLRTLTAAQSSVINNTMLIQIAVLAWVFLGERLNAIEIAGLLVVAIGTLLVQVRYKSLPAEDAGD